MKVSGNKILITGGSKGIGLALAQKFLSLDNEVIITGRNEVDLENVAKKHPDIHIYRCDLSIKSDIENLVLYLQKEHGDLNILINNAGIQYNYAFEEEIHLTSKIEYEIKVNLEAPIILFVHLFPLLRMNENPVLVNVTSALAMVPKSSAAVYSASKAALHNWTKSIRMQFAEMKVFEIIPALIDTEMTKGRGKNKMSTEELANKFIRSFEKDQYEINIGKVKILRVLNRIIPRLASKIINKKD